MQRPNASLYVVEDRKFSLSLIRCPLFDEQKSQFSSGTQTPEGGRERTLELLVEARDAGRDREVDGLVADVDDDAAEGALVDPVFKDERLFPGLGHLGLLQGVLEALLEVLFEGLGGRDDDLDLSAVGLHDLEEAVDDLVGLVEATVLGQDGEQVAGQVGRTFRALGRDRGGEEGVESGGAVLVREDGVREEVVDLGVGADGGFDALEVRLDLLEGVGLGGGGEEGAGVLASEACGAGVSGWVGGWVQPRGIGRVGCLPEASTRTALMPAPTDGERERERVGELTLDLDGRGLCVCVCASGSVGGR